MTKPASWKTWEGRTVEGKFPLRQYLGGSEHSAVFLTDRPSQKSEKTAIKLMEWTTGDKDFARLEAAKKLSHPHLIRIFEAGRSQMDGTPFVYATMECADDDLSQILPQRALTAAEVSDLLPPLLDALTFLHGRGWVHSRIKPSNILAVGEQLKLSSDQITAGAPDPARKRREPYDAPETSAGMLLPASDIWSLGQIILEALTQKPLAENPGSGQPAVPAIPEPFRGIVRECLQVDPKRRCTLAEIYARLQPEARSVPHPTESRPVVAPGQRRPGPLITVAVVLVVLVAIGVFLSRRKSAPVQNSDTTQQPATQTALPASPTREPAEAPKKPSTNAGEVTHQVIPQVPRSAQNTITGTIKVTVRVDVDASGKVTEAKFRSEGSSRYFAEQALRAARGWEFSPPLRDGQPASSTWLIHFRFRRTSIQASAEPTRH